MLRLTILFAAVASSSYAFTLPSAVASLTLQETKGFEVTAHGLVEPQRTNQSLRRLLLGFSGRTSPQTQFHVPHAVDATSARRHVTDSAPRVVRDAVDATSTRRLLDGVSLTNATDATQVALTLSATPKRADHLASTDDPIDECVAVLANGDEPDEEMLAKCQDIAREEFANQATLEDENSY